jgi:hypothetical protein
MADKVQERVPDISIFLYYRYGWEGSYKNLILSHRQNDWIITQNQLMERNLDDLDKQFSIYQRQMHAN